ncbi:MAG: protein kinase [Acidobacteria bacterium]|nr:protein kinase [Acidobacteriota bacterium]
MTTDRWQQIEGLFQRVSDCQAEQREAFLAQACAGDEELRREVRSLLACDQADESFLEEPIQCAAQGVAQERTVSLVGKQIGPYRITALIGRGGMGSVYRAVRDDAEYQKEVALKLVKRGLDSEDDLRRFKRERQILARLDHPYIARLLDGGATEEGLPYFVMELVEGSPITEYGRSHPIPELLALFRRVCAAVEYAHRRLIVHRDLKPQNILVTPEGTPKLLDFGIAKLLSAEESTHTLTAFPILTPDYASPEQQRGEPVTTATDVYSLGRVLEEVLKGQSIPEELAQVVQMARNEEPERRYRSVEQFSEDLRRYLEGLPVTARKDTILYRARKFVRRNKLAVAASVLAIVSLAAGTVVATLQARRAERRLNQLRSFARTVIFDKEIFENLRTLSAREKLISTTLTYLDTAARESRGNAALERQLAGAYQRIAAIQGGVASSPTLGVTDKALASYEKAASLFERLLARDPQDRNLALQTANVYNRLGDLAGDDPTALRHFRRALEIAEPRFASGNGKEPTFWNPVKRAYIGMGQAQLQGGDPRAAVETLTGILKRMSSHEGLIANGALGSALWDRGDLEGAARVWNRMLVDDLPRILGKVAATDSGAAQGLRSGTGNVLAGLGNLYGNPNELNLGDVGRGLQQLVKAQVLLEDFVHRNPDDADAGWLGRCYAGLGALTRDPVRALEFYRKAVPLLKGPALAASRAQMAYPLRKLGRRQEAASELETALEAQRTVFALSELGDLRLEQGDAAAAMAHYREAVELGQREVAVKPYYMPGRRRLADAYSRMARLHEHARNWEAAGEWHGKSLAIWKEWTKWGVSSPYNVRRERQAAQAVLRCETALTPGSDAGGKKADLP